MKYIFVSIFIILSGCSQKNVSRVPANDEAIQALKSRIQSANNPFEILNLHPGATEIEIETRTNEIFEQISGWKLFELTKYTETDRAYDDLVTLTEREQDSLKKVVDSYSLMLNIRKREGFKIGFGKWKWNLGKKDLKEFEFESFRDIQIFYEDKLGSYEVKWTSASEALPEHLREFAKGQNGYQVKYSPHMEPEVRARLKQIKSEMNEIKGKPGNLRKQIALMQEAESIRPLAQSFEESQEKSMELVRELDLRYKSDEVLPTYLLRRAVKYSSNSNCSNSVNALLATY